MEERADWLIVGAGILGCSLGLFLARMEAARGQTVGPSGQGDIAIRIVDRGPVGSGSTGLAAGLLTFRIQTQ